MKQKDLLRIVETLKDFRNILLGNEIEVLMNHNNITYEKLQSASQCVHLWKILIQEFGVTILYIKGEANLFSGAFIQIPMVHHAHKLSDTALEEDTCELFCLDSLFITDNTEFLSLDIEDISFLLTPHIVEAGQKLELQDKSSTNIRTNINKDNSDLKYNLVKGINLVHYQDRIYVTKTLLKRVLKWYNYYLQHPGGDRISQKLTNICKW